MAGGTISPSPTSSLLLHTFSFKGRNCPILLQVSFRKLTLLRTISPISLRSLSREPISCFSTGDGKESTRRSHEEKEGRRSLLFISTISLMSLMGHPVGAKTKIRKKFDEKRLLEQNRKMQVANNAPEDFPSFLREGFEVKVVTSDSYVTFDSGLICLDILDGKGDYPKDGQQVTFHYTGYNESGRRIDSTYLQGSPAKVRLGNKALVPGFEEGLRSMRPGAKRRIIIPPELGPPVGPSTFFSSKQFEVFDIELLAVKDCQRRTIGFFSDVYCD